MTLESLPRMLLSETDGWSDVVRMHPSVTKLLLAFVIPMSLIPALMYAYAALAQAGAAVPLIEPPLSVREASVVGGMFVLAEVAMVMLMAVFMQQTCQAHGIRAGFERAFALAAIAPTPLWLAPLALFVPSTWTNIVVGVVAWVGCVALLRHGVRPLMGIEDADKAHNVANGLVVAGVSAWIALLIVLGLLLSMVLGFR